jgi:hypothetical protein
MAANPTGQTRCSTSHRRPQDLNIPVGAMSVSTMLRPAYSTPTDHRFLVLVLAAVLNTGRRTVPTRLRTVRSQAPGPVSADPRVFSQRRWSAWALARALITCLLDHVVPRDVVNNTMST